MYLAQGEPDSHQGYIVFINLPAHQYLTDHYHPPPLLYFNIYNLGGCVVHFTIYMIGGRSYNLPDTSCAWESHNLPVCVVHLAIYQLVWCMGFHNLPTGQI